MSVSTDYQFLEAAAFGELGKMQSLVAEQATNHLNVAAVDEDGDVLIAANRRFHHGSIPWQPMRMNALHLSCLMTHEHVIQYLITKFPALLDGRCGSGETPLLTLTRTIGLVATVSDQCFESFLHSGAALNSCDDGGVNSLHHLAKLEDNSKLASCLNFFTFDLQPILTTVLPESLIGIIATYGNFYSKAVIANTLNQVAGHNCTPLSFANDQTRPLLLKAGAVNDKATPVIANTPSKKRKKSTLADRCFGKKI